ncbi:single-strand DNA endonuclease ASTE1 [Rhynchocyon petersi]
MGIRGLMSFVDDHQKEFFSNLKLQDTRLVIDGYALFHWLCFRSNLELRYGGDYDCFADVVQEFFEALFACHIHPYVVLDGGCDISDNKFATLKDRARERIQAAHSLSVGGNGCVCPLLVREVFIQVLTKLHVSFVQCFSEADQDIMTLANHWNCPVLSSDSDFCIFDLKAGFCPLSGFQWRNVTTIKGTQSCYIPATCFSVDAFCRFFSGMDKALLPLFAVLCGNDYISLPGVEMILSQIRPSPGAASPKGRRHQRVLGLLNWLSRFTDPADALDKVVKSLPRNAREEAGVLLSCAMRQYQQSPVELQDFFQHGAYVWPDTLSQSMPQWVREALAKGQLSPFISDALLLRRTFLLPQVENTKWPNAHRPSQPLRQVIYSMLLSAAPCQESRAQPPAVSEVARASNTIRTSSVQVVKLPPPHCDLSRLPELPLDKREMLLLQTLKVTRTLLDAVPPPLRLPVAISCYWAQHSEVQAKLHQVQALLLGMLLGPLQAIADGPEDAAGQAAGARRLCTELLSVKARMRGSRRLDVDSAQVFSQWQSCLQMGLYLNQLLCTPLPEPDLTRLYSGSLVHGLSQELPLSASTESLLSLCPQAKQLYEHLLCALQASAPPELFSPKEKARSKTKRQKKKGSSKNKVRTSPSSGCMYEGSNRFKVLMVENVAEVMEASHLG